jgi:hypothetical protein
MKSAYELAMERLNQEYPSRTLSDEEKVELADIDKKYDAKIAEVNLTHDSKVATLNPMELMAAQQEMNAEVASLNEKRESEKDALWNRED